MLLEPKDFEIWPGWDEFISSPSRFDILYRKKQQLLKMAKNGESRPHYKNHPLGQAISSYTSPSSSCYDREFTEQLKEIAPNWFVTPFVVANKKKQQLLEMAKNGEDRPSSDKKKGQKRKTLLGRPLCSYTRVNSGSYDGKFDKQIRELRPDWFITQFDVANQKKKQLLKMARDGKDKPINNKELSRYTKSNGDCYDLEFDKTIRELRPDWFVLPSDRVNQKKQQLLEMAKNGEPRPTTHKHPMAASFWSYTGSTSSLYDAEFTREIKKIAPSWFVSQSNISNQKKQQLLEMAKNGEPRPNKKHPLVTSFNAYIGPTSSSYDVEFKKEIKGVAPNWFVTPSDIVNQKKQQLLEIARAGEKRPTSHKHPLGYALCTYTNPNSPCYDKKFHEELKQIARPNWFTKQRSIEIRRRRNEKSLG